MATLHIDIRADSSPQQVAVTLAGEIDLATSARLRRDLADAIVGASTVVVDMASVEFIDASGIGALVSVADAARRRGATLWLVHPSPIVRRVLALLDRDGDALPVRDDPATSH